MLIPRVIATASIAVLVAACSMASPQTAPSASTPPLRVCVTDSEPPVANNDEAEPGVEVEYGRAVATKLGRAYEPVWIPTLNDLIPSLRSGKCEVIISGLFVTDERSKLVTFSNPTWGSRSETVMRRGESATFAELTNKCVATLKGSVSVDYLRSQGITPRTYGTNEEALAAVASKECDAAYLDSPTIGWKLKSPQFADLAVVPALTNPTTNYVGMAVDQGQTELLAQLNDAAAQIRSSGELEKFLEKYGVPAYLP